MAIYLIRHAETASNAARVMQQPDARLSDRGVEQARRLGERLRNAGIRHVLASDYARARETAEAVCRATGASLELESLLEERNFGDLRGRAYADFIAEGIDPFADDYVPPNGESWEAFRTRVARAWLRTEERAAATTGDLAVITHGLVCSIVIERHVSLAPGVTDDAPPWHNTGVNVVEGPPWRVTLFNCAAHLARVSDTGPA
jgi:probable phosphoglycerate mutase